MRLASPSGEKVQIFSPPEDGKGHPSPAVSEGTHTAQAATPEVGNSVGSNMMDGPSTSHVEVPKSEEAQHPRESGITMLNSILLAKGTPKEIAQGYFDRMNTLSVTAVCPDDPKIKVHSKRMRNTTKEQNAGSDHEDMKDTPWGPSQAAAPALEKDPSPLSSQGADSAKAEAVPKAEAPASTKTEDESKTDKMQDNGKKPKTRTSRMKDIPKGKEVDKSKPMDSTPDQAKPEEIVFTRLKKAKHAEDAEVENGQLATVPRKRRVKASTHDLKKAKKEVEKKEEEIEHSKTQDPAPAEAVPKAEAPAAKTKDESQKDKTKHDKTEVTQDPAQAEESEKKEEESLPRKNLEKEFHKCEKEVGVGCCLPLVA